MLLFSIPLPTLNVNLIISAVLAVLTLALFFALLRRLVGEDKSGNRESVPQPEKKNGKNDFSHCALNDIMGYDFVKVQQLNLGEPGKETDAEGGQRYFSDSHGQGVNTEENIPNDHKLNAIGAHGTDPEDEPTLTLEEKERNRQMEEENKRKVAEAEQSGATEVSSDMMSLMNNMDNWPEDDSFGDKYEEIIEDEAGKEDDGDSYNPEDDVETLTATPENPAQYEEITRRQENSAGSEFEALMKQRRDEEQERANEDADMKEFNRMLNEEMKKNPAEKDQENAGQGLKNEHIEQPNMKKDENSNNQ